MRKSRGAASVKRAIKSQVTETQGNRVGADGSIMSYLTIAAPLGSHSFRVCALQPIFNRCHEYPRGSHAGTIGRFDGCNGIKVLGSDGATREPLTELTVSSARMRSHGAPIV